MKICMCRDFDESTLKDAILSHAPEHAEQLHKIIKEELPDCGACLAGIQAILDHYHETGEVPPALKVKRESRIKAAEKLGERFAEEAKSVDKKSDIPIFKRRYVAAHNRQP